MIEVNEVIEVIEVIEFRATGLLIPRIPELFLEVKMCAPTMQRRQQPGQCAILQRCTTGSYGANVQVA